jgi:hypothetical protein
LPFSRRFLFRPIRDISEPSFILLYLDRLCCGPKSLLGESL